MVQPHKPKKIQRTVYHSIATYCQRNFEAGWTAKELLTKPAMRAFLCVLIGLCDMSRLTIPYEIKPDEREHENNPCGDIEKNISIKKVVE